MKTFIAALAMLSALLISDSRADVTKEWCVQPKENATPEIALYLSKGLPVETLNEFQSQAYIKAARNFIDIPEFPGVTLVIAEVPGLGARAFFFKGENYCARLTLPWKSHEYAMKKAKGVNI